MFAEQLEDRLNVLSAAELERDALPWGPVLQQGQGQLCC